MWAVAKIKIKNLNTFKKNLFKKLGKDIKFYHPKIEYDKYFGSRVKRVEKFVLENYIFCFCWFVINGGCRPRTPAPPAVPESGAEGGSRKRSLKQKIITSYNLGINSAPGRRSVRNRIP